MDPCAEKRNRVYMDPVLKIPQACSQFCEYLNRPSYRQDCATLCPDVFACLSKHYLPASTSLSTLSPTSLAKEEPTISQRKTLIIAFSAIGVLTILIVMLFVTIILMKKSKMKLRLCPWCRGKKTQHYNTPVPVDAYQDFPLQQNHYGYGEHSQVYNIEEPPWASFHKSRSSLRRALPPLPPPHAANPTFDTSANIPIYSNLISRVPSSVQSVGIQYSTDDFENNETRAKGFEVPVIHHPSGPSARLSTDDDRLVPARLRQQASAPTPGSMSHMGSVFSVDRHISHNAQWVPFWDYEQPIRNADLHVEHIIRMAEKEQSVVSVIFFPDYVEVFYDSEENLKQAHSHYSSVFGLNHPVSLVVNKLSSCRYDPHTSSLNVGRSLSSQNSSIFSAGAFLEINDQPHVLSATHGQLHEGEPVFIQKPKMRLGKCRISLMQTNSGFCDASLISLDDIPHIDCSNQIPSRKGDLELTLFEWNDPMTLLHRPCHVFKHVLQSGSVDSLKFYYFDRRTGTTFANCIAVTSQSEFSAPGDSGRVVCVQQSANQMSGFGVIAGQIRLQFSDESGQHTRLYTLVTPMPRILNSFMQHPYCRGKRLRMLKSLHQPTASAAYPPSNYTSISKLRSLSQSPEEHELKMFTQTHESQEDYAIGETSFADDPYTLAEVAAASSCSNSQQLKDLAFTLASFADLSDADTVFSLDNHSYRRRSQESLTFMEETVQNGISEVEPELVGSSDNLEQVTISDEDLPLTYSVGFPDNLGHLRSPDEDLPLTYSIGEVSPNTSMAPMQNGDHLPDDSAAPLLSLSQTENLSI